MIQRIQTVFLFMGAVLTVLCLCLQIGTFTHEDMVVLREYNLWTINAVGVREYATWPLFALLIPSASLALYTIFIYSNRIVQARFCLFNVLLLVGWYILYVLYAQLLGRGDSTLVFTPSFAAFLPAISIVFYMLARYRIWFDEKKVRSADRIR